MGERGFGDGCAGAVRAMVSRALRKSRQRENGFIMGSNISDPQPGQRREDGNVTKADGRGKFHRKERRDRKETLNHQLSTLNQPSTPAESAARVCPHSMLNVECSMFSTA